MFGPTKGEQYLSKLRDGYKNTKPNVVNSYNQLINLSTKKLWHQLTEKLVEFVKSTHFMEQPDELIDVYELFIKDFDYKLNQLKLGHILICVASKHKTPKEKITFLEDKLKRLSKDEAKCLVNSEIANNYIKTGNHEKAKEILEEIEQKVDQTEALDSSVYASFHKVHAIYFKKIVNATQFYRQGLLYLAYVKMEEISNEEKKGLARDLILSALVSKDIYSFGELTSHPILQSIENGENGWLVEFVNAFNNGDIKAYHSLLEKYKGKFDDEQVLVSNEQLLSDKIAILSLIELVFSRPSQNRTLTFLEIAKASNLKLDDVELLVMRALSVGLIKGEINEVTKTVEIEWVQPRILSLQQIETLKNKIDDWKVHVKKTLNVLEEQTDELFI